MKIAVLGTGRVGGTLGRRWMDAGHEVMFGTRDPAHPRVAALASETGARSAAHADAVEGADAIVLAIPWPGVLDICDELADRMANKVVIDCVNPLNATFSGLDLGFTASAAEEIASRCPRSRVVKAFNTVSSATMADPSYAGTPATLFHCGDDTDAKRIVADLANAIGFFPVDSGPLAHARLLEPLAMLYIHLAMNGWGSRCAIQIVRR